MRLKQNIFTTICCFLLLLLTPTSILAATDTDGQFSTKDEVIYGNLNYEGQVTNMYVVNSFFISKYGVINDYGSYAHIKNLTNLTDIEQQNTDIVQFHTEEDQFFYQGELEDKPLPWDISINYLLDGKEVDPNNLAGKSGDFEIHITTDINDDVDPLFFEHYLLQISLTLDPQIFSNIHAPKGTEVNEGKNKQINFSVLPGQKEVLITSARVNELEMDPIQITAIPAKILLDEPDTNSMTDDLHSLAAAIRHVNTSVKSLKDGVNELDDGITTLKDGSTSFRNGLDQLDQSSKELVDGSTQFKNGLNEISGSLKIDESISYADISTLSDLSNGLTGMTNELNNFASALKELDNLTKSIPNNNITKQELEKVQKTLQDANASQDVYNTIAKLEASYQVTQSLKMMHNQLESDLNGTVEQFAEQLSLIATTIEQNSKSLEQLDNFKQLIDGLNTFAAQYETFHNGLVSYTNSVHTLATSYKDIDQGLTNVTGGIKDVNNGLAKLYDGTSQLHGETSNLPHQMESEIEQFLAEYDFDDFNPISFVSPKNNENIGVVQFVLQTEKIELEEDEETIEKNESKQGWWDLFLNLFK